MPQIAKFLPQNQTQKRAASATLFNYGWMNCNQYRRLMVLVPLSTM